MSAPKYIALCLTLTLACALSTILCAWAAHWGAGPPASDIFPLVVAQRIVGIGGALGALCSAVGMLSAITSVGDA